MGIETTGMIICRRPRKKPTWCSKPECNWPGLFLCDYPVDGGTCDRRFCQHHGHRIASEIDYCWEHYEEWFWKNPDQDPDLSDRRMIYPMTIHGQFVRVVALTPCGAVAQALRVCSPSFISRLLGGCPIEGGHQNIYLDHPSLHRWCPGEM